jgi:Ca2+-binding RTX toxin-like protein
VYRRARSGNRWRRSISPWLVASTVLAIGLLPTAAGGADAEQATLPVAAGSLGVVGCSNTAQHVRGYLAASGIDQMPYYPMGGLSFEVWGDPAVASHPGAWGRYDASRPSDGYQAAWVMLCLRANDDHDPNLLLTEVIDQIHSRDPGIPVYVSPINEYGAGHVCERVGPDAFTTGLVTIAWGIANLGIEPGPVTGPLTPALLSLDLCHLNSSGVALVGDQLVDWFDEDGWLVECDGVAVTMVGSSGANVLEGTPGRDIIHGLGGADHIEGRGGNDLICGGAGGDVIDGNAVGDVILGGPGGDDLDGQGGGDRIYGGSGGDGLRGQAGADTLIGGLGNDSVDGGAGVDACRGETVATC